MTRAEILDAAKECVCGQREQDYGTPESNFQLIANLWRMYLGVDISATDVAMMMALMKIARIKNGGGTGDSFVDLAGYAACGGEINAAVPKEEHVNTEVKRRSGRYPWDDPEVGIINANEESVQKDYRLKRYCTNCKYCIESSKSECCNTCCHNSLTSTESHWEKKDDKPIYCKCVVVDKTIKAKKFPNEESVREDSIKGRYCDNCKWQDEDGEGEHCEFCSHNEIESDESHWEREELPHTRMTCRYNREKSSEEPCFNCVDYNHWEERE